MAVVKLPRQQVETESTLDEAQEALVDLFDEQQQSLDGIYPFSWTEYPDYIESGENDLRVIAIADYPPRVAGNWMSELRRMRGNVTLVQYYAPAPTTEMLQTLNRGLKNTQANLIRTHDPLQRIKLTNEIQSAERMIRTITSEHSAFVHVCNYVVLQATSLEELNELTQTALRVISGARMQPLIVKHKAREGFRTALPLADNQLWGYSYRMMDTAAASSMMPFDDAEVLDLSQSSIILGTNKVTGSLVAIDLLNRRKTLNQNMVILGTSGVGKSTLQMALILREYVQRHRVMIMDPEDEYGRVVAQLGGQTVTLSSSSHTIINPFEILSTEIMADSDEDTAAQTATTTDILKHKIQTLKAFFHILEPSLTAVQLAIIDRMLWELYTIQAGITDQTDITQMTPTDWPTMADFYAMFEALKANDPDRYERVRDVAYVVESLVNGSTTLFTGHTNVDMSNPLLCINLKPLQNEPDVQAAAYFNTFSYLWDRITSNREDLTYLFVDEFHFLAKNPDSMRFFYNAVKRFRKYNAGVIATTQQVQDVLDAAEGMGAAVIENSYTKIFFGLEDFGVSDLQTRTRLKFSAEELSLLKGKRQGEALLDYGGRRVFFRIDLTPEELRLWDPAQYAERYQRDPKEVPDYVSTLTIDPIEAEELKILD